MKWDGWKYFQREDGWARRVSVGDGSKEFAITQVPHSYLRDAERWRLNSKGFLWTTCFFSWPGLEQSQLRVGRSRGWRSRLRRLRTVFQRRHFPASTARPASDLNAKYTLLLQAARRQQTMIQTRRTKHKDESVRSADCDDWRHCKRSWQSSVHSLLKFT